MVILGVVNENAVSRRQRMHKNGQLSGGWPSSAALSSNERVDLELSKFGRVWDVQRVKS